MEFLSDSWFWSQFIIHWTPFLIFNYCVAWLYIIVFACLGLAIARALDKAGEFDKVDSEGRFIW